jgi:hypothetical protein
MRQAARRAWRIGQPRECYVYYLYYKDTMQHRAMHLMSKKMAAALALEGEFSEDGLAAMAGDDNMQMVPHLCVRQAPVSRKDLRVRQHLLKLLHPT